MALNSDIRDQAYQFFVEEAPELLQVLEVGLLTLRQERSTAKVHELMRAAHSLKGGAASVGLEAIKALSHRLENIFKAFYSEALEIDTDLEGKLLQAYDCLRLPLIEQTTTGNFDAEQALAIADPIFAQIEERLGDALLQADSYIPSSTELGVDMVKSIFEVDVGQGLERLAAVAAHPQDYEVAGELRAQAEVFTGFAELLNLPEFGAIAETVIAALNAHPDCALEITQLALVDFQHHRQAVLAGDRVREESPSAALVALATSPPHPLTVESSVPLLEDIFGSATTETELPVVIEGELVVESAPVTEEVLVETVSLEEVFGSNEVASALGYNPQSPITNTHEILKVVQPLEQFDLLPTVREIPTPTLQLDFVSEEEATVAGLKLDESVPGQLVVSETSQLSQYNNNTNPIHVNQVPVSRQGEAPITPNLTVRVDSERLGRMNNLVGELVINRNGLSLQNEQVQKAVRNLLNRFSGFQDIVGQLRQLSDKMLVEPTSGGHGSRGGFETRPDLQQTTDYGHNFDSLEMDSYGALHSVIQEIFEDMVQLEEAVDDIALFTLTSEQKLGQQKQVLNQLRDEVKWSRMLPVGEVLQRFPRMLRDLSTTYHKPVNLKLSGTGVLVDKAVLEKLSDPLLHLLRNAFDHGIEPSDIRRQLRKPEQGQIEIRAYHKASQTIIEVHDDGRGLNLQRIRSRALELKLLSAEQLSTASQSQLFELIFEPGFSTARQVSELSGRGVGLDVVRSQLRSLKGTVTVTSSAGEGTTFTLKLPLTLTITKLLVCLVSPTAVALPSDSVEEIVIPTNQTKCLGTQRFLQWQGQLIPVYRIADFLRYNCPLPENYPHKALAAVSSPAGWAPPLLVLRSGAKFFVLEVDSVVTEQESAIKSFGSAIAPPHFTYGCTILGDGSVIPVIDGTALLDSIEGTNSTINKATNAIGIEVEAKQVGTTRSPIANTVPTVLVVDDSVALRRTLALTLEKSGFRVLQARDGQEAIEQLQQSSSVQLIVCDVEMPKINGFEFLNHRRQTPQIAKIPVVMLTSRSSDKHRNLAMHLGATAYFSKPFVEQGFLKAVKDIISQRDWELETGEKTIFPVPNP